MPFIFQSMRRQDYYTIQFSGLSTGSHYFEFEVENTFFDHFENEEIKESDIHVGVELLKHTNMLELFFTIHGTLKVMCDICTYDVNIPITSKEKLIVKFGEKNNLNEEIITLAHGEHQINISPFIYEFALLALPVKRVHAANECDKEMIKKVNEYVKKAPATEQPDPRWAALKNIKLN